MSEEWEWTSTEDGRFEGYQVSRKLSNGSTAWFGANRYQAADGVTLQYDIEIEVYRKRRKRDINSRELTGPGGTEAPGFFLETLARFEEEIARPGDRIQVEGSDGRRYRVYHRVLGRRGYRPTRFLGVPMLVKIVT